MDRNRLTGGDETSRAKTVELCLSDFLDEQEMLSKYYYGLGSQISKVGIEGISILA